MLYEVITLEAARDGPPETVHDPEHFVAFPNVFRDDPEADQVVDLFELDPLPRHLVEDPGDVLGPSRDGCGNAGIPHLLLQDRGHLV